MVGDDFRNADPFRPRKPVSALRVQSLEGQPYRGKVFVKKGPFRDCRWCGNPFFGFGFAEPVGIDFPAFAISQFIV